MSASDYPVEFGYMAQDGYYYGPNGIVGLHHRGNDRSTPTGTPILISGINIGNTGATGLVGGPHLHTQAGTDIACQNTVDPSPLDFKPGTVVAVGRGTQWGNYITIQVGDKYITYAHLSWINVAVGQLIGGEMSEEKFNEGDRANICGELYNHDPGQHKDVVGKPWKEAMYDIFGSAYYKQESRVNKGDVGNMSAAKDASGQKGKAWKQAAYDFLIPNQAPNEYVETKVYIKK